MPDQITISRTASSTGKITDLEPRATRASSDALRNDEWPTLFLYDKLDIFKHFYKGYNATLSDSLSKKHPQMVTP